MDDLAMALTQSIAANGVTLPTANLPMGGFNHTGVGPATLPNQYARADQVQTGSLQSVSGVATLDGLAYTGTLAFNSGGALPLVALQPIVWVPNIANTGPVTLALNGGAAVTVLSSLNTPLQTGQLIANTPYYMVYNGTSWILASGGGASQVNSLASSDPQILEYSQTTPGNYLSTIHSNVPNGTVKLSGNGKIPITLLNLDELTFVGLWDAFPGILPPNGTVSGAFYVITKAGTLNLFVTNGVGGWVQQMTPVSEGDYILWNQQAPEPTGYYWVPRNLVVVASNVANVPTPSFVATDLQSWISSADAPSGFLLATGARRATGTQFGGSWYSGGARAVGQGIWLDGANFRTIDGVGTYGWLRLSLGAPGGYVDYVSTTAPANPNDIVSIATPWFVKATQVYSSAATLGVFGGPARQNFTVDIYQPAASRLCVADTSVGMSCRMTAASSGAFFSGTRQQGDGTPWVTPGLPLFFQLTDDVGTTINAVSCFPNRLVQIGNNANALPGAIASTYKALGAVNGPIDFNSYQTAGVNPASIITAITMAEAQVGRILINGAGAITLPASVKLPKGGAVYGAASTVIGLLMVGGIIRSTFIPYDV